MKGLGAENFVSDILGVWLAGRRSVIEGGCPCHDCFYFPSTFTLRSSHAIPRERMTLI